MSYNHLPPLNALYAFEAAVRHSSFKEAATELNLTPGAISQQVKKLEQWLGFSLFHRDVRQLKITKRGLDYYSRIAPALEVIQRESKAVVEERTSKVCLSLGTALAAKWLTPRIGDFMAKNPDINVYINATNETVDFHREHVDLAIRYFDGKDETMVSQLVFPDEIRLLCTPEYRDNLKLYDLERLVNCTLIHSGFYLPWNDWLRRFTKLDSKARSNITALNFDQPLLAIEAAKQSQGVILSNLLLTGKEISEGNLIEPFPIRQPLQKGYHLVYPNQQPLNSASQSLRSWLLEQFAYI